MSTLIKRDADSSGKLTDFFNANSPFRFCDVERLVSLLSCVCVTMCDNVTCDKANTIGINNLKQWEGMEYSEVTVRRGNAVKTLASIFNTYKVGDEEHKIDANKLFQRLVILAHSQQSLVLSAVFKFEITVYPTSLFKAGLMRKPDKPALLKKLYTGMKSAATPKSSIHVVDGGCLLHKVRWVKGNAFADLLSRYETYVEQKFGQGAWAAFDG
jgi:hypothetical protein